MPGTVLLAEIRGFVGILVWLMQAINGDLSRWTHVAIMIENGDVFEAAPGGATVTPWEEWSKDREWSALVVELNNHQRYKLDMYARLRNGTGYNWSTYFYLAAYRLRLPLLTRLLRRRVEESDLMICSQAVDDLLRRAGHHLFDDGRLPFDVTPGDIGELWRKAKYREGQGI